MSTDLRLALAPERTYRILLESPAGSTWPAALRGPALAAMVIGASLSIVTTGRITLGAALTIALSWSWTVVLQLAVAGLVIATAPGRRVPLARAVELFFLGHAPWSLYMLAFTAYTRLVNPFYPLTALVISLLPPVLWTAVIIAAFCRTVLQTTRGGARGRAALHQTILWACALAYVAFATGGPGRLLRLAGP